VWDTAKNDLPIFGKQVSKIIKDLGGQKIIGLPR
jgi:uncharacterized protein with HEPN domain